VIVGELAAAQLMRTEEPQVSMTAHGACGADGAAIFAALDCLGLIAGDLDLTDLEAGQFDIEIERCECLQLNGEDLTIPIGQFGEPVVGERSPSFLLQRDD
jgi:hypothetical protein